MGKRLITLLKRVKMSNDTKYYTPSIEEFHVGFEFETSYLEDYDTWKKVTLEFDDFGFYTSTWEVDSNPTEFRVKYLDKEDIESFGFNLIKEPEYKHPTKEITLNYFPTSHSVLILSKGYNSDLKQPETKTEYWYQMFGGIIKNKSELKRLLKQLEIYE